MLLDQDKENLMHSRYGITNTLKTLVNPIQIDLENTYLNHIVNWPKISIKAQHKRG